MEIKNIKFIKNIIKLIKFNYKLLIFKSNFIAKGIKDILITLISLSRFQRIFLKIYDDKNLH